MLAPLLKEPPHSNYAPLQHPHTQTLQGLVTAKHSGDKPGGVVFNLRPDQSNEANPSQCNISEAKQNWTVNNYYCVVYKQKMGAKA